MRRIDWIAMVMALTAVGCSSDDSTDMVTPTPTPVVPATFTNVQMYVLTPSCTNVKCHDATASGSLDLREGNSYSALVNVPAVQPAAASRGKIRVIPKDPINSFLIQKLDGTMGSDEGDPMPRKEASLVQSKIELIRQWIKKGALND